MNTDTFKKQNGSNPNNALDAYFQSIKQRALLSPIIVSNTPKEEFARFVDFDDFNTIYRIATGVVVMFLAHNKFGSFYPHWIIQSVIYAKKNGKVVKLEMLTKIQRERIDTYHRELLGSNGISYLTQKNITAYDVEWRVPFSESDILLLGQEFQDLIRRTN